MNTTLDRHHRFAGPSSALQLFVILVLLSQLNSCSKSEKEFGAASKLQEEAHSVSSALNEVSFDKTIRMRGKVGTVCPDDACWLLINDNANVIRVELSDAVVAAHPHLVGKECIVEGIVKRKMVPQNSVGYDAYEKSCAEQSSQNRSLHPGIVLEAYRIECP